MNSNKIIIGSANFENYYGQGKNKISSKEIQRLFYIAKKNKIHKIDTSPKYGKAEEIIGKYKFSKLKVISKIGKTPENINDISLKIYLYKSIFKTLKNLKNKKIESILIQNSEILLRPQGKVIYNFLSLLKDANIIKKIGISIYDYKNLKKILNNFKIDLIQAPLNIVDTRLIETGWLERLRKKDIEVHVRSIFFQGLLLLKANELPKSLYDFVPHWERWENWLKINKLSPMEACVNFVTKFKHINKFVIGFNNSNQLKEILLLKISRNKIVFPLIKVNKKMISPLSWNNVKLKN
jgi:aryl-alcohol dehydrogenase-like predicted oxidoreductase